MKDKKFMPLRDDSGLAAETSQSGSAAEKDECRKGDLQKTGGITFGVLLLISLVFFASCMSGTSRRKIPSDAQPSAESEMVFVTEAQREETERLDPANHVNDEAETVKVPDPSWMDKIFGKHDSGVVTSPLRIFALTENEKELINFRESDFIKSLSSFLLEENIKTSEVTFKGSVPFSSKGAAAYEAKLNGIDNKTLVVLLYPEYPGRFQYLLIDQEKENTNARENGSREENTGISGAVTNVQNQPASSAPVDAYDASSLEVRAIPAKLYNYLKNPYELQYGLYDHLYKNGVKNARSAVVTGYEIDADRRSALITLNVDGGRIVKAVYDLDSNTYSFQ